MHRQVLRSLSLVVLLQALCAAPAAAQASWSAPVYNWGSGSCQGCYELANVDSPNLSTPWTATLDGWAFWCSTGEIVQRVDVYYWRPGVALARAKTHLQDTRIPRPDVEQYFRAAACPAVPVDTGWQVAFDAPVPSGTWVMSVVFWHGSVSTTQTGLVVVPER